ncbi:hypothetical protein POM88_034397 [Heracleum sosnowskyi]|uniref:Aldehyde dehydrogenase domain-containing protein n=1 Tax=Heracleum sosnowskyi TaxID=360622 RepID=A0AAD8HLI2_9APIA|nr:hypothetical protein POM88_034397 [Heracleum sosnowskyi]
MHMVSRLLFSTGLLLRLSIFSPLNPPYLFAASSPQSVQHLTPVTMELGGKCPTIFDSLSGDDMKVAVRRIASGKWGPYSGQACVGIDNILVEHKYASNLIDLLKKTIQ